MVVSLLVLGALAVAPVQDQGPSPGLLAFLQQQIGLDSSQIAAVQHGDAVVKVLDSPEQRDIALFGIVGSKASREAYIEKVRNFQTSLRAPTRTRFGIFHDPAVAEDVEAVVVSASDLQELKDCRPGNCVTKLPATDMQRLQSEIDWTAPDLQGRLTSLARKRLVEYVAQYRASGDSAMVVYDDRARQHVHSSDVFAALLAATPYLYQKIPSLQRYFASYPRDTLPGAAEVVYWAEDVLPRLRPILSVTHLVVYAPPELPRLTVIASKQIYANHYFESALEVSCVEDGAPGGAPGSYLFVLRRYRFDNLPSGGIANLKGRAIGALRNLLAEDLKRQREGGRGGRENGSLEGRGPGPP
jgi:hypothetical protein